jgi:FtsP/CotA-like multicopper oxidase with cupredoxin domain
MTEATVMPATRVRSPRVLLAGLVAALVAALLVTAPHQASAAPAEGLACETPASPGVFNLTTMTGYIFMPDGNSVFMWGYAGSNGFQIPGPTLCVDQGTQVTVNLTNTLAEPVSIIFPGQTGVQADGQPVQPVVDGGGRITSLVQPAAAKVGTGPAGTVSYTFTADRPGTYLYTSGTDQTKQIQMGLYGALVVRPAGMPNRAYASANTAFTPGHEYLHVLSEIDPALHLAVERRRAYDIKTYLPRYFLINGRAMPDTLAPNDAAWLPGQPYGAMVHVQPGQVALIRYLNVGMQTYPFHPHGNDQRVIARDGNPLVAGSTDLSYEKFLVDVGPGQTVDALFRWDDVEHWSPGNPVPVELPPLPDQLITGDTWFSESPYLGYQGELPVNVTSNNECGEYYHIAHSHALEQSTNFGTAFGGMMTLIRIDPPTGCVGTAP